MHWAVRSKKEPMLEASNAEIPVASQAEDLQTEPEEQRIPPYEARSSASECILKCSLMKRIETLSLLMYRQGKTIIFCIIAFSIFSLVVT